MPLPTCLREKDGVVYLSLKVQPRASSNEIGGVVNDELKVKVTAPPVDSAANEAVIRFLAEVLTCPRSAVQLVRGATARHKTVAISGLAVTKVVRHLKLQSPAAS